MASAEFYDSTKVDEFIAEVLGQIPTDAKITQLAEAACKYKFIKNYTGGKLTDAAINHITFTAESASHALDLTAVLPDATEGKARDLLLQISTDATVDITTTGMEIRGDSLAIDGEGEYIITVTEFDGYWFVKNLKAEVPA